MEPTEKFFQISLTVLKQFVRPIPFDIYIERDKGKFTKLFKKDDVLDWERVTSYEGKGVQAMYTTQEEYSFYSAYVESLTSMMAREPGKFDSAQACEFLKEMVVANMNELLVNKIVTPSSVENSAMVVQATIEQINRDPKALFRVIAMMNKQPYLFKHSTITALLSVILAKAAGIISKGKLQIVGTGAYLHDVGIAFMDFNPEELETFTADNYKAVQQHPELGKKQIDSLPGITSEIIQIVLQHHEQPNGAGYPNHLREGMIYMPAKVVAIADAFSAMISKRGYRAAFTPEMALRNMRDDVGKFDKKLLDLFESILVPKA
ncbi:MAG: HD domain-containing phosphohydrolase [Pseudomonadota bacterium]